MYKDWKKEENQVYLTPKKVKKYTNLTFVVDQLCNGIQFRKDIVLDNKVTIKIS